MKNCAQLLLRMQSRMLGNIYYLVFLLLILLLPLRNVVLKVPTLWGIGGLNLTNILYGIVFLGILFSVKSGKSVMYRPRVTMPLLLFVFYFFLQIFMQPGFYSYSHLVTWWKDAFLFMLIPYFFVTGRNFNLKKIFIILGVMVVANVYMDSYFWRWVRWMSFDGFADKMKSVNGTFGDVGGCNEWAAFFSTYTLLIVALMGHFRQKWLRSALRILVVCNVLVLLFTFSRGGYLAFVIGLLYLFVKEKRYVLVLVLLFLPLFYAVALPEAVVERVQMSFESSDDGGSADQDVESRLEMWQQSIDMILKAPVFGHGMLSFRYNHWRNPHNQHLNILVQGGIVGYGLFLWLFVAVMRDCLYLFTCGKTPLLRAFGVGMCAATLSLFVANVFGDRWSYYILTGYFWVLIACVNVLIQHSLSADAESGTPA